MKATFWLSTEVELSLFLSCVYWSVDLFLNNCWNSNYQHTTTFASVFHVVLVLVLYYSYSVVFHNDSSDRWIKTQGKAHVELAKVSSHFVSPVPLFSIFCIVLLTIPCVVKLWCTCVRYHATGNSVCVRRFWFWNCYPLQHGNTATELLARWNAHKC